jgi:hypothetical protein
VIKTFDPAPPNIEVSCQSNVTGFDAVLWMLVGRTG